MGDEFQFLPDWLHGRWRVLAVVLLLPYAGMVLTTAVGGNAQLGLLVGSIGSVAFLLRLRAFVADQRLQRLREAPLAALNERGRW